MALSWLHCTAVLTKEIVYGFNIESDIVVYLSVVWGLGRDHDLEVPRNYLSLMSFEPFTGL